MTAHRVPSRHSANPVISAYPRRTGTYCPGTRAKNAPETGVHQRPSSKAGRPYATCGHHPDSLIGRQNAWLIKPRTTITTTIDRVYGTRRAMSIRGCSDWRREVDSASLPPDVLTWDTPPPRSAARLRTTTSTVSE
jgi:hypothetical protein